MSLVEYGYASGEEEEILEGASTQNLTPKDVSADSAPTLPPLASSSLLSSSSSSSYSSGSSLFSLSANITTVSLSGAVSCSSAEYALPQDVQEAMSSSIFEYTNSNSHTATTAAIGKRLLQHSTEERMVFLEEVLTKRRRRTDDNDDSDSNTYSKTETSFSAMEEELMPSEPEAPPSESLLKTIKSLLQLKKSGRTVNRHILEGRSFQNPYLLEKIMGLFTIEPYCSNFPPDVYDPNHYILCGPKCKDRWKK